jgi:hypothetical protein
MTYEMVSMKQCGKVKCRRFKLLAKAEQMNDKLFLIIAKITDTKKL